MSRHSTSRTPPPVRPVTPRCSCSCQLTLCCFTLHSPCSRAAAARIRATRPRRARLCTACSSRRQSIHRPYTASTAARDAVYSSARKRALKGSRSHMAATSSRCKCPAVGSRTASASASARSNSSTSSHRIRLTAAATHRGRGTSQWTVWRCGNRGGPAQRSVERVRATWEADGRCVRAARSEKKETTRAPDTRCVEKR